MHLHLACKWNYFNYFVCGEFWWFLLLLMFSFIIRCRNRHEWTLYNVASHGCFTCWVIICWRFRASCQKRTQTLTRSHLIPRSSCVYFVWAIVATATVHHDDGDGVCLLSTESVDDVLYNVFACAVRNNRNLSCLIGMTCEWRRCLDACYDIVSGTFWVVQSMPCTQCMKRTWEEAMWQREFCHISA